MSSIRKSFFWAFIEKYFSLVANIISTIVIARLLTPAEIGVFSVAAVIIGIAHMLRDFGVGQYIIQEKELTKTKIRSAFGFTLFSAWFLAFLLWGGSSALAKFYNEPGIEQVVHILALTFILIPFGSVTLSLLNRQLAFDKLFKIKATGALVHAITGISLAFYGFGYISLAWAALANVCATILMAKIYHPRNISLVPSFKEIKGVFSFGYQITIAALFNTLGTAAPDLTVGKTLGMEPVGYFSRAFGTVNLFSQLVLDGITQILLPHFSESIRQGVDIKPLYLKLISYITCIGWPFFIFLAFMASPVLSVLYGDQWNDSVSIVQLLCVYAAIDLLSAMYNQVYIASGAVKKNMVYEIQINILLIVLVLIASNYSLEAVAIALIVKAVVGVFLVIITLRKLLNLQLRGYLSEIKKSFQVSIISSVPIAVLCYVEPNNMNDIEILLINGVAFFVAWFVGVAVVKHPICTELPLLKSYAYFKSNNHD